MSILIPILIVFHVAICLLIVLTVLMQRPRSEGLGAAFGGGMTDNLFGAQTTHVLQKFTVWFGGGFFLLTLLLAILYSRVSSGPTSIQMELLQGAQTPAAVEEIVVEDVQPATTVTEEAPESVTTEESTEIEEPAQP